MSITRKGRKNFGMMGREVTPLRSMAAYVACIQSALPKAISRRYSKLRRLRQTGSGFRQFLRWQFVRCGVRRRDLHRHTVAPNATIPFPIKVARVAGADGRTLAFGNHRRSARFPMVCPTSGSSAQILPGNWICEDARDVALSDRSASSCPGASCLPACFPVPSAADPLPPFRPRLSDHTGTRA